MPIVYHTLLSLSPINAMVWGRAARLAILCYENADDTNMYDYTTCGYVGVLR